MDQKPGAGPKLPFGLEKMDSVVITYAVQAGKSGAGREEITISGGGEVRLLQTLRQDAEPTIRTGKVPPETVMRLLELFKSARFTALDPEQTGSEPLQGSRSVALIAGATQHAVVMIGGGVFKANEFVGAIKVVAGMALPEITQGGLLRYM